MEAESEYVFENACITGNTIQLARLIALNKFNVNKFSSDIGVSPLTAAITIGSLPTVALLLDRGANPNNVPSTYELLALNEAITQKHPELLRLLLDKGANPNIPAADTLARAVSSGKLDLVQLLLDRGADLTLNHLSALRAAIIGNEPRILELLLDRATRLVLGGRGAIDEPAKGYVMLCKAVLENNVALVAQTLDEILAFIRRSQVYPPELARGISELAHKITGRKVSKIFVRAGIAVESIYLTAKTKGDVELQEFCLAGPVSKQKIENLGKYALFEACRLSQFEVIKLLVNEYGFDLNKQDYEGITPIFLIQDIKMLSNLLSTFPEVNLNLISGTGCTLLGIQSDCEFYRILLEHGADPWVKLPNKNNQHVNKFQYNSDCTVIQHLKKLFLLDSEYMEKIMPEVLEIRIEDFDTFECLSLERDCKKELEKMEKLRISQSTSEVTGKNLLDFIFLGSNEAARYSRNVEVLKIYEKHNQDFKNYMPQFGFALNYQLRRGQVRCNLLESALEMLCSAIGKGLPEAFAELIFGSFSNRHLDCYNFRISER